MRNEKKNKTLRYKRVHISKSKKTLQQMLENVLLNNGSLSKASSREELLGGSDDSPKRLLNHPIQYRGMLFCQFVLWEKDQAHKAITTDKDADSYSVRTVQPKDLKKKSQTNSPNQKDEFLESTMYFGVNDNDLVFMASSALTDRQLETHLSWLLGSQSKELPDDGVFFLRDQPTQETQKKVENSHAKKVSIGAPINVEAKEDCHVLNQKQLQPKSIKFVSTGLTGEILATVMSHLKDAPKLKDALDDANLKLKLELTYVRKTSSSGQEFLDELSTSLRHQHEDDVEVTLSNGTKLKGKDLKLSTNVSVEFNNGAIDENDLYHSMHDWLQQLISNNDLND